jgi:hypothetical protein
MLLTFRYFLRNCQERTCPVQTSCIPHNTCNARFTELWPFIKIIRPSKMSFMKFCNKLLFCCEEYLAPHPTPKLEDHTLSAARYCLLNILAAALLIWRPSDPPATKDFPNRGDKGPMALPELMKIQMCGNRRMLSDLGGYLWPLQANVELLLVLCELMLRNGRSYWISRALEPGVVSQAIACTSLECETRQPLVLYKHFTAGSASHGSWVVF